MLSKKKLNTQSTYLTSARIFRESYGIPIEKVKICNYYVLKNYFIYWITNLLFTKIHFSLYIKHLFIQ
ncbi:MAG: hypothetical protein BAJALOKI3v1_940007 [Promethearchaeota archaeon]|nr:MAG: hypothetical protein BAJALOKI3v1_940007 [Candidatus Lokiarchaeota archaeon]